jgi:hypothetical protein
MRANLGAESPSSKRGSSRFRSQKPVHVAAARWWSALDLILNITCGFHRRLFPKIAFTRELWHLAQGRYSETIEEEALRTGISLGMTVIDAAEIYSGGHSEELVGRVMAGRRDQAFIVSQVTAHHVTWRWRCACWPRASRHQLLISAFHWMQLIPFARPMFCDF